MTSANGRGALGFAGAAAPGGRVALAAAATAGAPATVALVADDAGTPTGVLGEGAFAAVPVAGGGTVAQEQSIAAMATNKTDRADRVERAERWMRESTAIKNSKNRGQLMRLSPSGTGAKALNLDKLTYARIVHLAHIKRAFHEKAIDQKLKTFLAV